MTATHFMGIDPGLSGAIAVFDPEANAVQCFDMPTFKIMGKSHVDLYGIARIVDTFTGLIKLAVIEDVGARPGQGVSSMFKFGFSAGAVQGVVAANFIPTRTPRPQQWKKIVGLPHGADKTASRRLACQKWPAFSHLWARVKDDGRAEAALLAYFGSKEQ
jgi:crossover junction endodeoxyribonuclease RuvC